MSVAVSPAYTALLRKFAPRIIRSEEQNERCIDALHGLDECRQRWNAEERELADLLTLLIEDFEAKHYALPRATPLEAIAFLMDQHDLKQKDMADVFGSPSVLSEIMHGRRELTRGHIQKLSERFSVSPEIFF